MYIDEEKKFIFFHNFKTGGTTIESLLNCYTNSKYGKYTHEIMEMKFNQNVKHASYEAVFSLMPNENLDQYFKFCFVRNPYTRTYSSFLQIKGMAENGSIPEMKILEESNYDFNNFVHIYGHKSTNLHYTHYQDKLVMNFVGKFENFEEDLKKVCARIEIPYVPIHANHRGDNDYLKFYTSKSIEITNNASQKDFELLGYEMLDPKDFPDMLPPVNKE